MVSNLDDDPLNEPQGQLSSINLAFFGGSILMLRLWEFYDN